MDSENKVLTCQCRKCTCDHKLVVKDGKHKQVACHMRKDGSPVIGYLEPGLFFCDYCFAGHWVKEGDQNATEIS